MEDLKSAMGDHMDQMADLVEKLTAELRSGLQPAYDHFIGFFHAIDWTVNSLSLPCIYVCVCMRTYVDWNVFWLLNCLHNEIRWVLSFEFDIRDNLMGFSVGSIAVILYIRATE